MKAPAASAAVVASCETRPTVSRSRAAVCTTRVGALPPRHRLGVCASGAAGQVLRPEKPAAEAVRIAAEACMAGLARDWSGREGAEDGGWMCVCLGSKVDEV